MRKLFTLVALFVVLTLNAAEIGTWKAYPVYRNVTWIEEAGNLLYVLASDNLYSYNTNDGSITDTGSSWNRSKLLQGRKLFLNYTYSSPDGTVTEVTDTLTFRNRIRDGVNEWQDENPQHYK